VSETLIKSVADRLIDSWHSGRRQPVSGLSLPDANAAYTVQRLVTESLGWFEGTRPCAWKLGGAPGGLVSCAAIPSNSIHPSGWQVPARYAVGLGIEGELAIRLGRDLSDTPDIVEIRAAIDAWLPAIELCDTRLEEDARVDPLLRLADQQLNRALILGEPFLLVDLPEWTRQPVVLEVNGHKQLAATGSHPFVDPLASLPWLARHAAEQNTPLRAGDLIATGSWTGLYWASWGQRIDVGFGKFGKATLLT